MKDIIFLPEDLDTAELKVMKGERGLALLVSQEVTYPTGKNILFANKVLDHEEAKELRDFLISNYPPEEDLKYLLQVCKKEVSVKEMWDYLDPIISKVSIQTVDEKEKTAIFYYDLHDDKVLAVRVTEDGKVSYWLNI